MHDARIFCRKVAELFKKARLFQIRRCNSSTELRYILLYCTTVFIFIQLIAFLVKNVYTVCAGVNFDAVLAFYKRCGLSAY